ncbi:hypothetical protein KEM63_02950 [Halopseudomonas nanhaiensis]|uniref:hypothetical protein n=1 Tax=Halopseudomonas nanhaiensis TaxID=2830842 RepID=UPI001CBD25C2|nr:hypothetical protein [Halopseudomonas nanhaiensis]UAW98956.1 hypothetical protein KEM63_02950 [Halopseudomonas nanhaiensis]
MAIKGNRTKALPVRERTSLDWRNSGPLDTHLSPEANKLATALTDKYGDDLPEWLGLQLGRYKGQRAMADASPSPAEELALADETIKKQEQAELMLNHLPPGLVAELDQITHSAWSCAFEDLVREHNQSGHRILAALTRAQRELAGRKWITGRKPGWDRRELLADIITYLLEHHPEPSKRGVKRQAIRDACGLLSASHIHTIEDIREAERIVSSVAKQRRELGG